MRAGDDGGAAVHGAARIAEAGQLVAEGAITPAERVSGTLIA